MGRQFLLLTLTVESILFLFHLFMTGDHELYHAVSKRLKVLYFQYFSDRTFIWSHALHFQNTIEIRFLFLRFHQEVSNLKRFKIDNDKVEIEVPMSRTLPVVLAKSVETRFCVRAIFLIIISFLLNQHFRKIELPVNDIVLVGVC